MRSRFSKHLSIAVLLACLAAPAIAQDNTAWGTRSALSMNQLAAPAAVNAGTLNWSVQFANASFGTGGVGLRNRGEGAIQISGVSGPIKRAHIYWAVVTQGAPTTAVNRIEIKRGSTGLTFATLVGTPIGSGATPCWQGDRTTVYRSVIPLSIATGNGLYIVRLKPGANGSTAGGSPWALPPPPLPLFEGASIVIVGTGTSRVAIYDTGLAGKMFFDQLSYRLNLPVTVVGSSEVLLHTIGADGQIGTGVKATALISGEVTTLNGVKIAGPGSPAPGDWNGILAAPLPQLWDNATHDVTTAAKANVATTLMTFGVKASGDCVVTIANVMSVR